MNLKSTRTETGKFFVTPQGSHRHAVWSCARSHQPVGAPEPVAITERAAVTGYLACSDCCTPEDVKASETAQADAYCTGRMLPGNPRRIYRTCECGYEGKVGSNGLRAHKTQK
jgi:hypothetical protein